MNSAKFSPGDKVKIVMVKSSENHEFVGETGVIERYCKDSDGDYWVDMGTVMMDGIKYPHTKVCFNQIELKKVK